jgi:hypothetical protein
LEAPTSKDGASFHGSEYVGAEAHDKILIDLPPVQRDFAKSILALGKTVVLVVLNGGSVDIGPELQGADAAIEAFYPGLVGAGVIANAIFGHGEHFNRWGRMPCACFHIASCCVVMNVLPNQLRRMLCRHHVRGGFCLPVSDDGA